jgi:hypothetical protein
LDALADPMHPARTEYSEWIAALTGSDEPFDPDHVDIAEVNRTLTSRGI